MQVEALQHHYIPAVAIVLNENEKIKKHFDYFVKDLQGTISKNTVGNRFS